MNEFDWIDRDPFFDDSFDVTTSDQLEHPLIHERKEHKRRFINGLKKQALNDLIPVLPPPDVDLYIIGNGSGAEIKHGIDSKAFDFGTFIPHIIDQLGDGCTAYISSWTMNRNHALNIIELMDTGAIQNLTIFTDPYFQQRSPAIAATLIEGIQRHTPNARYLAFKNHVKAMAIANADETRFCSILGSANLSSQPRCENYTLTTGPDVYQFLKDEFFEGMLCQE